MPLMMLVMNCITVLIVWFGAQGVSDGVVIRSSEALSKRSSSCLLYTSGETDTQELVRLLRRANEIIDHNQERRDAE